MQSDKLIFLKSMVTNKAIAKYVSQKDGVNCLRDDLQKIPDDHRVWFRVGHYLA